MNQKKVILLMVLVLCIGLFMALRLPIYPDEVAYRVLLERYFQSGGYKQSLLPYCIEGFQVTPPHLLKLSAIFWSFLGQINTAYEYRVIPIITLALSLGCLFWFASRNYPRAAPWFLLLFMLGVPIYALVIIRPEVFILFSFAILAISGLYIAKHGDSHPNVNLLVAVGVSALFILVSYTHPKAVYLILPTLITLGLIMERVLHSPMRVAVLISLAFSVVLTAYDAVQMHKLGFVSCKSFPEIEEIMNSQGVNILEVFSNAPKFFSNLWMANDLAKFERALTQLIFRSDYDIGVLPLVPAKNYMIHAVNILIQAAVLATFIYVTIFIIINSIKSVTNRKIEREFLVYLGICAVAGCQYFFNITKHWYDITLAVSSLGILAFIGSGILQSEAETHANRVMEKSTEKLQRLIAIVILLSVGINFQYIYKKFEEGFVGIGISTQIPLDKLGISVQKEFQQDLENADQPIIIDDLTYSMFKDHVKTLPITYLMLHAKKLPATIDAALVGRSIIGITRCTYWNEFDLVRKTTLLSRVTFNTDLNAAVEICRWSVH